MFLVLSSCTLNKMLWTKSYDESFKNFLISKDGKYVVFMGTEFVYVLNDDLRIIQETLNWKERDLLFVNVDKTNFVVDQRNHVKGYVTIECLYNNITSKQEIFLKSMGYKNKNNKPLTMKIKLDGVRYLMKDNLRQIPSHLTRNYIISVNLEPSFGKRIEEVALTPITIIADSILLFGKIILMPFDLG